MSNIIYKRILFWLMQGWQSLAKCDGLRTRFHSGCESSNLSPCKSNLRREVGVRKSPMKEDFNRFSDNLKQVSMSVSWHQLQQLQSVLHKTQTKRFAGKRKTPKYGSLSKAFSDTRLQRFLHVIDSDRFRLLFRYQA